MHDAHDVFFGGDTRFIFFCRPQNIPEFNQEENVCILVEFALAMCQMLQEFNKNAFNSFYLRIGICSGPLVSGVIGAKKPVYDIWGNTVNVASRMDSTGSNWKIQVPDYTAELLREHGYMCTVSLTDHSWFNEKTYTHTIIVFNL